MTDPRTAWNDEVQSIIASVNRKSMAYLIAGYGIYGVGSVIIMVLMRNQPAMATAVIMFFFQLCVIYFGTRAIFPCISGGFWLSIAANRDSVPTFKRLADAVERLEQKPDENPLVKRFEERMDKATLDFTDELGKLRNEVKRMADGFVKPIVSPIRKIVAPPTVETVDAGSNGSR